MHSKKRRNVMATTRTAEQLIQDLFDLEITQVHEHPPHPTHPLLLGGVYRVEENKIDTICYIGKTVRVKYTYNSFGYEQADFLGRNQNHNCSYNRELELKPTASVKRQLEKYGHSIFESVAEFKETLLHEKILDVPDAVVASAAGVLDALTKNNMYGGGKYQREQEDGTWLVEHYAIMVATNKIEYSKGVLTIEKIYWEQFENGRKVYINMSEDKPYEQVVLALSAQVRTILREAGFVGNCIWHYDTEAFSELLVTQARKDKLRLLVA